MYKKRTSTRDPRWGNRNIIISGGAQPLDIIPVGDTEVICNSCNANVWEEEKETFGYLIYFSKQELEHDKPYDFYCGDCTIRSFINAVEVHDF